MDMIQAYIQIRRAAVDAIIGWGIVGQEGRLFEAIETALDELEIARKGVFDRLSDAEKQTRGADLERTTMRLRAVTAMLVELNASFPPGIFAGVTQVKAGLRRILTDITNIPV